MERKEAIKILKLMRGGMKYSLGLTQIQEDKKIEQANLDALEMAISSLETDEAYQLEYERTTKNDLGVDCISRESAIKAIESLRTLNEYYRPRAKNNHLISCDDAIGNLKLVRSVYPKSDAIPLPDNATNGDIIKALFNCEVCEPIIEDDIIHVIFADKNDSAIGFDWSWWNAPYRKEQNNDPFTQAVSDSLLDFSKQIIENYEKEQNND